MGRPPGMASVGQSWPNKWLQEHDPYIVGVLSKICVHIFTIAWNFQKTLILYYSFKIHREPLMFLIFSCGYDVIITNTRFFKVIFSFSEQNQLPVTFLCIFALNTIFWMIFQCGNGIWRHKKRKIYKKRISDTSHV